MKLQGLRYTQDGHDHVPGLLRRIANNPEARAALMERSAVLLRQLTGYPIGKARAIMALQSVAVKGDKPGHEFHGNQYTDAEGYALTRQNTNFYQGVFYMGRERAEGVAAKIGGKAVKRPRGYAVQDAKGRLIGPGTKWDEDKHPRAPAGSPEGGEFAYQGTYAGVLDDVLKQGLKPGARHLGRAPAVYLARDEKMAIDYAFDKAREHIPYDLLEPIDGVIFKVKKPADAQPDTKHPKGEAFFVHRALPADQIVAYRTFHLGKDAAANSNNLYKDFKATGSPWRKVHKEEGELYYVVALFPSTQKAEWDESEHPREPAGSPEGGQFAGNASGIEGLPKDLRLGKAFYQYHEAAERGGFVFKAKPASYAQDTFKVSITPKHIPEGWKEADGQWYDPEYAKVGEYGHPQPKELSIMDDPAGTEPGVIYRGMSYDEYQGALKQGYFQSKGGYNLGTEQEGLTYFSQNQGQASYYASGFAPWQFKATPDKPAVMVAVRDPGHHKHVEGTGEDEVGIQGRVPVDQITDVYYGHPFIVHPGDFEVRVNRYAGERNQAESGSSTGYSASLRWVKRTKKQAAEWDEEKHPRAPAGSAEGGEFTESVGIHGDTATFLHGTTEVNAKVILQSGFGESHPNVIAAAIEKEFGLPSGSVYNDVHFEFARNRSDLDEAHFTSDLKIADSYSVPEQLQDALKAAYHVMHPPGEDELGATYSPKMDAFVKTEASRLGRPAVLEVTIPWSVVGKYGFGRELTLSEYKAIAGDKLPTNVSLPISALGGVKIRRIKWDESKHPRAPAGSSTGGEFTDGDYADLKSATDVEVRYNAKHVNGVQLSITDSAGNQLPLNVAKKVAASLDRLTERFPMAAVEQVGVVTPDNLYNKDAWGEYLADSKVILLNSEALGHDFEEEYKRSTVPAWNQEAWQMLPTKMGYHPEATSGVAEVITHEFGHAVHAALLKMENRAYADYALASGVGLVKDMLHEFTNANFHGASSMPSAATATVSAYAQKNEKEWFAETFAAVFTGVGKVAKSPQVKRMRDFLNDVVDQKKWRDIKWLTDIPIESGERPKWYAMLREQALRWGIPTSKL